MRFLHGTPGMISNSYLLFTNYFIFRIYEDHVLDMGARYQESQYYGVNKFVMKSEKFTEEELKELKPGTYTKDEVG